MIQDSISIILNLEKCISILEMAALVIVMPLWIIFNIGWVVVVTRNIRLHKQSQRRLTKSSHSGSDFKNKQMKITQGKLLLTILVIELVSGISYCLGFLYPQLIRVIPFLGEISLPFNTTCISQIKKHQIWILEYQYPLVAIFLNIGRVSLILTFGVAISFFQFISNTYVSGTCKNIYRCIWYTAFLTVALFILGVLPYTTFIGKIIMVIALVVYYIRFLRQILVLKKAMKWEEQDLYHNYEVHLLKLHRKNKRYFNFTVKSLAIGLLCLFCVEALQVIEMVTSTFLYYGECIFPVLYHIDYFSPLATHQLPYLDFALILFSCAEKTIFVVSAFIFLIPYITMTIILFVKSCIERKKRVYHYKVYRPLLDENHDS